MATSEARVEREALRQLNLYEVLQVSAKASPEVVQAAYRVLARLYHPDVNDSPNAARMMRQVNAAYRVLSDPERRAKYDAQRAHSWRARPAPAAHNGATTHGGASATPHPTRPNGRVARTANRASSVNGGVVLPMAPASSGWRIGRLISLLLCVAVVFGGMLFGFWILIGILEDETLRLVGAG